MSVKVGVRVRPFNQREQDLGCKLCVEMVGNTTRLLDVDDHKKNRDFAFDYSFWSHDGFQTDANGYFQKTSGKYADQQLVYESVGKEILDNAWQGYHCCLFAYGQTGSGKSYSMIGYGANKGIVPISCEQIFKRIHSNADKQKEFEVNLSMLEIYNEKVQDLLIPVVKRPREGLKIREHKIQGVYVEGLSKHFVDTYDSIEILMQEGNKNRSVAATEMNASSSRAHTIISIEFRQKEQMADKKVEKLSVIFLVDLAGSERVEKTGAHGETLKQAANINRSLSVLGLVISTLADKAMGKGKHAVVPYRDSALTRILQNALGGNSKTLMICAISPATDNYDETLSTLRYADQAKKIQNKAIINESETDRVIRELTEENEKLKKFMEMFSKLGVNLDKLDSETLQKLNEAKSELKYNSELLGDYNMTRSEKLDKAGDLIEKFDETKPHIVNLNEDPMLSKKIRYSFQTKPQILIGRKNAEPPNDIVLGGVGVRSHHATITNKQGSYFLSPTESGESESNCFINGQLVTEPTRLFHEDRLVLGSNSTFLILIPGEERRIGPDIPAEIDWEFAQEEMYHHKKQEKNEKEDEAHEKELKQREEQEHVLKEKEEELEKLRRIQQQQEQIVKEMQKKSETEKAEIEAKRLEEQNKLSEELEKMKHEVEVQRKKIKDSEQAQKNKMNEKNYFQHKLTKYIPKVIQVNLIAKEFKRNISMAVKLFLIPEQLQSKARQDDKKKKTIKIQVDNRQTGYTYFWDIEKFSYRYYLIKDLWEKYLETGEIPTSTKEEDPFWDASEHIQIGNGFLTMLSLAYMLDQHSELALVAENGECGMLEVGLIPTDQTGTVNLSSEFDENQEEVEPEHLIDHPFNFTVEIVRAEIPEGYENIYVEYALKLKDEHKQIFQTQVVSQKTRKPVFNYRKNHGIQKVSAEQIGYLKDNNLCFKVFGQEYAKQMKKQTPATLKPQQPQPAMNMQAMRTQVVTAQPMPVAQQKIGKQQQQQQQAQSLPKKDRDCTLF